MGLKTVKGEKKEVKKMEGDIYKNRFSELN
jgi:hypothetical protein